MELAYRRGDELEGKVALVVGGSRNIGRGVARALAAAGAGVMVNARTSEDEARATVDLIRSEDGRAAYHLADVTDPAAVEVLIADTVRHFGRLDILSINQTLRASAPIERISYEEFRRVVAVTLDGSWLCCKAAVPHLTAAGGGAIVMMGGQAAITGSRAGSHVSAAKHGLLGLTRSLAKELASRHITVNLIHPYAIDTQRVAASDHPHESTTTPIGRMGRVEEVAALVRHLCGPAGGYITGQSIFVNGGAFIP
ncbi:MAG TPA: SDR family NAD(P)-dependent oxidoreductase [Chloroflexota bacterium]|nr:SDR family NAD(P)-dependent oxidoreductase [Chloroflexota bacterium]